jgi:hypothetical protein
MGAAEVIAFEEVRARNQWDTLRHQLPERFDQWLDTLETQWRRSGPCASNSPEASPRRSWRMSTVVHTTGSRSPVRGVRGCCGLETSSVAPSKPWPGLSSLSGRIFIVGRAGRACTLSTTRWGSYQGVNSSICKKWAAQLVTEVPYDTA